MNIESGYIIVQCNIFCFQPFTTYWRYTMKNYIEMTQTLIDAQKTAMEATVKVAQSYAEASQAMLKEKTEEVAQVKTPEEAVQYLTGYTQSVAELNKSFQEESVKIAQTLAATCIEEGKKVMPFKMPEFAIPKA